jgi:hypothetical protein
MAMAEEFNSWFEELGENSQIQQSLMISQMRASSQQSSNAI